MTGLKSILDIVAFIVVIGLGVYQLYNSIKRFKKHVDARNEFLAINKDTLKEEFLDHQKWAMIYGAAAIALFALGIRFFLKTDDYLYATACFCLGLIFAGYVLDCFVTRRSWYYEDGFYFENKFYRYRSLAAIEPKKGLTKTYEVRFHAHPTVVVAPKMADKVKEKEAEWKKNRKDKKKQERLNG